MIPLKALKHFLKMEDDNQHGVYSRQYIARLYAINNNFSEAEKYVLKIKDSLDVSYAYGIIGNEFYKIKSYNYALSSHLKAIKYNNKQATEYYAVAINYYLLGQPSKAIEYFDKACDIQQKNIIKDPDNYSLYWGLSWYSLFAKKPQEAIRAAKKSLELSPGKIEVKSNLALGYLLNNEYEKAKSLYIELKNSPYTNNENTWKKVFLADIKDLEKMGIIHNDFDKIKQLLNE